MAQRVRGRRWKGGSRAEPPLYEPSADDQWCDETRKRVAIAIGDWLIAAGITHRLVNSLTLLELEGVAEAAMVEYTDARCERYIAEEQRENDPVYADSLNNYRMFVG